MSVGHGAQAFSTKNMVMGARRMSIELGGDGPALA
jgi:hypothetical protein